MQTPSGLDRPKIGAVIRGTVFMLDVRTFTQTRRSVFGRVVRVNADTLTLRAADGRLYTVAG